MWYFVAALTKYATFSGRSTRREYWYFWLFSLFIAVAIVFIGESIRPDASRTPFAVFLLAIVIPSFSVTIRRLHDIGRSGWWALLYVVPVGGLIVMVAAALPSERGENKYGPNPLGDAASGSQ